MRGGFLSRTEHCPHKGKERGGTAGVDTQRELISIGTAVPDKASGGGQAHQVGLDRADDQHGVPPLASTSPG